MSTIQNHLAGVFKFDGLAYSTAHREVADLLKEAEKHRHEAAQALARWLDDSLRPAHESLRRAFAPGTPYGDLMILADSARGDTERSEAAQRLARRPEVAERLTRGLRAGRVVHEAAERQRLFSPKVFLRDGLFPTAILLAISEQTRLRRVRLGRSWVKGDGGRTACIRPNVDLSLRQYAHWVVQEAGKAARAELHDQNYPNTRQDAVGGSFPLMDWDTCRSLLDALGAAESSQKARMLLSALERVATPREREVLSLLRDESADPKGRAPSTIRVHRYNLRQKALRLKSALGI